MTPLERAAQAAKAALITDPETDAWIGADHDPDDLRIDGTVRLTPVVRAVLTAIREPSEGMVEAGAAVDQWVQAEGQAPQPEVWQAMIDAALAEGE